MLTYQDIAADKKAIVFELDDVLYPKRDYLLQVYYLFANLLEYTETVPPAKDLTEFLKTAYFHHGEDGLFERAAETFGIEPKYRSNFDRMHLTAMLPLKLWLYKPIRELMQASHADGKRLFILASGNPVMQLNKLRQLEWNGLEQAIKAYFTEELMRDGYEPMTFLLKDNGLQVGDVLYIHAEGIPLAGVDCIGVDRILGPTPSTGAS